MGRRVILWVYYTIPFGFSLIWHFGVIIFNVWNYFVWPRITDEGSLPEMRIWSILLIKSDLKWCIHLSRSLFSYWSRVGDWTGTLKNPTKCLWRWEPDRRSNYFFSPPAHLCVVTCMTEISLRPPIWLVVRRESRSSKINFQKIVFKVCRPVLVKKCAPRFAIMEFRIWNGPFSVVFYMINRGF